jgi:N-carbamoylputrescine amidase
MSTLNVALVQQSCTPDRGVNVAASIAGIRDAAKQGAQVVTLQELHCGPYFPQREADENFALAESIPGPSTEEFGPIARELGIVLVISLFERRAPGVYHNTAVVLERDGTIAGTYRKTHIPDDPQFHEKFHFTPGDQGIRPIKTSAGTLGVLVCWDQWYPEAARLMALKGADVLIYPTAIGWKSDEDAAERPRQLDAWRTIQRSHAIANGLPVIVANRTGFEPQPGGNDNGIHFWGSSFIAGCQGEILAEASESGAQVLVATLDRARTDDVRRAWPFFRDRRLDCYGGLLQRYLD